MKRNILCSLIICLFATSSIQADIIAFEDFDGGDVNLTGTVNVFNFTAGGGNDDDVFGIVEGAHLGGVGMPADVADDTVFNVSGVGVNPNDDNGVAGNATTAFFGMHNMDGFGAPGFTFATWTFDVSSATFGLDDIQVDIGAFGNFATANTDGFRIEAQLDGGGFDTIFLARTNESVIKTYRAFDDGIIRSVDDPLELFIDGSSTAFGVLDKSDATTGEFDTYTSTLLAGQIGSTLDIRLSWEGAPSIQASSAVDNFTINGTSVPEPSQIAFFIIGTAALVVGHRIRRRQLQAKSL